ncbi:hypothetical protein PFISCL1PPCAC_29234, partial [Pristionchus fissidentatus]
LLVLIFPADGYPLSEFSMDQKIELLRYNYFRNRVHTNLIGAEVWWEFNITTGQMDINSEDYEPLFKKENERRKYLKEIKARFRSSSQEPIDDLKILDMYFAERKIFEALPDDVKNDFKKSKSGMYESLTSELERNQWEEVRAELVRRKTESESTNFARIETSSVALL